MLTIPAASFSLLLLASLMIPTGAHAAPRPLRIVTINLCGRQLRLVGHGVFPYRTAYEAVTDRGR